VRDAEGNEGWVFHSLLTGKRTAVVAPWDKGSKDSAIIVRSKPDQNSRPVLRFAPGVIAEVKACDGSWCKISHSKGDGWVQQTDIWGVYPDEKLEK